MTPSQTISALATLISIRQPAFLWGAPGVGKSQIVAEIAQKMDMELRDIRAVLLDPVDLRGLPRIDSEGKAQWCPPAFLPDSNSQGKGIVFLDELNAATPLVQAACYQLVLDRRIGEYILPAGWTVLAAGNREKDKAVSYRMPSALANRMVHIEFETNIDDWLMWAQKAGIAPEVIAFLRFRPALLHNFAPRSSDKSFASPRSWEFLSRTFLANPPHDIEYELFQGAVGTAAASEFVGFLEVWRDLPSVESVLSAPSLAPVPSTPAAMYAICEALAQKSSFETSDALICYAKRLPAEFAVLLIREAVCRDERIVTSSAFAEWAQKNASVLL